MNDQVHPIETLFEKAQDYAKTTIELSKLNAVDKSAELISSLAVRLTLLLVLSMCVLVLNFGVAYWLGDQLGNSYYGFFATAGIDALIAGLIYYFRDNWIKVPVSNSIITEMLKKKKAA